MVKKSKSPWRKFNLKPKFSKEELAAREEYFGRKRMVWAREYVSYRNKKKIEDGLHYGVMEEGG